MAPCIRPLGLSTRPNPPPKLPRQFRQSSPGKWILVASIVVVRSCPFVWLFDSAWKTAGVVVLAELIGYYIVYCMFIYPVWLSPFRSLPLFKHRPLITGQLGLMAQNPVMLPSATEIDEIVNHTTDAQGRHPGLIRQIYAFNRERLVIASIDTMAQVLIDRPYDFPKPVAVRNILLPFLGQSLITVEGDEHRRQRRNVAPAFAKRQVRNLYPVFIAKGQSLCRILTQRRSNIDITDWFNKLSLDIVAVAVAGSKSCADSALESEKPTSLTTAYYAAFEPSKRAVVGRIFQFLISPWLYSILPLPGKQVVNQSATQVRQECSRLVRRRKAQLETNSRDDSPGMDVLAVAIRAGVDSDSDLTAHLMTFFMAGHETTSTALSWAIYELCRDDKIQSRLRSAITARIPNLAAVSADDQMKDHGQRLESIDYLVAFFNETLRLHPPLWLTVREAGSKTSLAGYTINKHTEIVIPIVAFNRSTRYWGPDSTSFNPDRWLGPDGSLQSSRISKLANLSFLHGSRACIGRDFAKAEFLAALACLVVSFEIRFHDDGYQGETEFSGIVTRPRKLRVDLVPVRSE